MNQRERRQVENSLIAMGLNGVEDPELHSVFAQVVEQFPGDKHWFFRGMLNECEPAKRREMYESLRPRFQHFKPRSLEAYEAELAEDAGRMVSHRVLRVEGKQPDAVQIGGQFYIDSPHESLGEIAVKLTCCKCTKQEIFIADTTAGALIKARAALWAHDGGKEICPKCPAIRSHLEAHA